MGRYLETYDAVRRAKQAGKANAPRLNRRVRLRIESALAGTRIDTLFESPHTSRLWRAFELACRSLDRSDT